MINTEFRSAAARFILCALTLALAGCGWFRKKDPQGEAESFLGLLAKGDVAAAYDSGAFAFQAQQNLHEFEGTAKEMGLLDFKSVTWPRSTVKPSEAKLDGEIVTKDGGKVIAKITLIRESGRWKIYSLRTPVEGEEGKTNNRFSLVGKSPEFNQVFKQALPSEKQIRMLVHETLVNFEHAIRDKNFDEFYKYISFAWQTQVSQHRMERAFKGFMDMRIDLGAERNIEVVFDEPPAVNSEGLLVVKGHYLFPPYTVVFSLSYNYELPKWKLYGIDVNCLK